MGFVILIVIAISLFYMIRFCKTDEVIDDQIKSSEPIYPVPSDDYIDSTQDLEDKQKSRLAELDEQYKDCDKLSVEIKGIFARSRRAKEMIPNLTVWDDIKLRREPSNPYDEFAVKVMCDGVHLGYVPAEESEFVSTLIKSKRIVDVVISAVDDGKLLFDDEPDPWAFIDIYYRKD